MEALETGTESPSAQGEGCEGGFLVASHSAVKQNLSLALAALSCSRTLGSWPLVPFQESPLARVGRTLEIGWSLLQATMVSAGHTFYYKNQ